MTDSADLAKVQQAKLPQLARLRHYYKVNGQNLSQAAKHAKVSLSTAKYWRSRGFLDPENSDHDQVLVTAIGPEKAQEIAEDAYSLVTIAQERVAETIDEASAREASRIAFEQHQIGQLASGQATSRVETFTYSELVSGLTELFGDDVIDVTAEEVTDAVEV